MAFPTRLVLVTLNDQYIQLDGLADGLTAVLISSVVNMTVTLKDHSFSSVTNATAIAMAAVSGAPGSYRGLIPNTFNPAPATTYTAVFDGTNGSFKIHIELPVTVESRAN